MVFLAFAPATIRIIRESVRIKFPVRKFGREALQASTERYHGRESSAIAL